MSPAAEMFETVLKLREEIDKLRLANLKQERQILVITQSMDAMLSESEQQKVKFQDKANQQHALSRFVDRVMDTMDDLLFVIDTEGRIRRLNTGVERELGFTEAELLGTGIDDLLTPRRTAASCRAFTDFALAYQFRTVGNRPA